MSLAANETEAEAVSKERFLLGITHTHTHRDFENLNQVSFGVNTS